MTQFKIQNRNRAFIFPGSRNHITGLNFIADIFFQRRIIAVDRKVAGAVIQNNQVSVASQVICKNHLAVPHCVYTLVSGNAEYGSLPAIRLTGDGAFLAETRNDFTGYRIHARTA